MFREMRRFKQQVSQDECKKILKDENVIDSNNCFTWNKSSSSLLISAFIWCRNDLVGNCYWMDFSGYNWYCIWYKNRKMVQVKNTAFAVFFISYFDQTSV